MKKKVIGISLTIVLLCAWFIPGTQGQASINWWLAGPNLIIPDPITPPAVLETGLELHAARQEYAPFQVAFNTPSATTANLTVDYPADYFDLTLYEEFFVNLLYVPTMPGIYTQARLNNPRLPDGLRPITNPLNLPAGSTFAIWADLFVKPDTPAGDYTITLELENAGTRQITVHVYPVDLPDSAGMSIILPANTGTILPFYAPGDPAEFHQSVNQLLLDNLIIPGNWVNPPQLTADGWDFSGMTAELSALPPDASFLTPIPFDNASDTYFFELGTPPFTNFDDPAFVATIEGFFRDLAAFLQSQNRMEGAYVYPNDEKQWVADEPYHDGPLGYQHLGDWTALIRQAGLKVIASGVTPAPEGSPLLGWLPGNEVTNNVHVPIDTLDAAPQHFDAFSQQDGYSTSAYLNFYGDLIDLPFALHRGTVWHAYGRGLRELMGYETMEWVDQNWNLIDPWVDSDLFFPHFGYGVGALVYPGPLPSLRLKLLREGVEDVRLLDAYASITSAEEARALAACLTPGALADQNPAPEVWDNAHQQVLTALSNQTRVDLQTACLPPIAYANQQMVIDLDGLGTIDGWDLEAVAARNVAGASGNALSITFLDDASTVGFWFGGQNWSGWTALQIDISHLTPYFTLLDIGLTDGSGNYILLKNGGMLLGPETSQTMTLPLALPSFYDGTFDWSNIEYLSIEVATSTEQTSAAGFTRRFRLGSRTIIFDNFRLVR